MASTLDVDLRPGTGLGMFELGTSLWTVIDILRHNTTLYPRVEVKFDAAGDSALSPILLRINPHLDLLFTALHQRLRLISLRRLTDPSPPIRLTYKDAELLSSLSTTSSSDRGRLRRSDVSKHFGPTYPGDGLHYPGVSFLFDEDGISGLGNLGGGDSLKKAASSPVSAEADDRYKEVKRVVVTQTTSDTAEHDALKEVEECEGMTGSIRKAILKVHDGALLYFYPSNSEPVHVRLGITTAQDLTCELGAPLRIYHKEDDRMAIHARNKTPDGYEDGYFYNYFQYGVDFLLSASTHAVQKVIVHTNIPGTPMFQRYQRCPWEIEGQPEDEEDDSPPRVKFSDKFDIISRFLNGSSREQLPSMALDRREDERLTLPNSTSRLVGFDGFVFEVADAAQVAMVVLF